MVTYKVKLEGSDGKKYAQTYEGLWDSLKNEMSYEEKWGWNTTTKSLREDVNKVRDLLLSELLIPKAKEAVLAFLKENPDVQTRNFYHKDWKLGLRGSAWYFAQEQLEAEGKFVSESHGKGQNRTWKLKETP